MNNHEDVAIYTAFEDFTATDIAEAEKNLMRAILKSAMEDVRKAGDAGREARRYLTSNDDSYLYSFISVCRHLDLCHTTIRTVVGLVDGVDLLRNR